LTGCPRDYSPAAEEIIPGDVTNVAVAFVKQKKENSQEWVARVNWTAPKGMDIAQRKMLPSWNSIKLTHLLKRSIFF